MDKVPDNQEIIHVAHIFDHAQLIGQAIPHGTVIVRVALCQSVKAELIQIFPGGIALRHIVFGKLGNAEFNLHITALRDFSCIFQCLFRIRKKRFHFLRGFHIILTALVAHLVLVRQLLASLDTEQDIMRLHVLRIGIMTVIGGYQRDLKLLTHTQQRLIDGLLFRNAVILQLQEIISFAKDCLIF